VATTKIKLK